MKQLLLLSTVLAAALAAGAAHAQTTGIGGGTGTGVTTQTPQAGAGMGAGVGTQQPGAGMGMGMGAGAGIGTQPGIGAGAGMGAQTGMAVTQNPQTVMDIQRALSQQGYAVAVDGIWGPQTQGALEQFQRDRGLAADGQPNPQTLATLDVQPSAAIAETPAVAPLGSPGQGQQEPTQDALVPQAGPLGSPLERPPTGEGAGSAQ